MTDRGIFTRGNEGRIEREIFFGVKIVNAGTCVVLLTDRGIFTGGNAAKEGREIFFGVKIVNAGTCDVKIVITSIGLSKV